MTLQGAIVEIAFTATPFADPTTLTWTDVSAKAMPTLGIKRGRSYELTQMQPGTLDLTLDNASGDFDPDNTGSAYYPHVKVGIPVRVRTTYSSTSHTLFYGFIESWQQSFTDIAEFRPTVKVTASDGMKAILSYALGQGYTDMLVSDYGGTVGVANSFFWPFNDPNYSNYYLNAATSNAVGSGDSQITDAISQTALQLSGAGSYFQVLAGNGDQWMGFDGWLRVDSVPAAGSVPKCVFYSGNRADTSAMPNLGFGTADGNTLSGWIIHYPDNLFTAAVADPTDTSLWTKTGSGSLSTTAITSTNGAQRIWLDDGSTDFYGATSALRLTSGSSNNVVSPQFTATSGQVFGLGLVFSWSGNSADVQLNVEWVSPNGTVEATTGFVYSTNASGKNVISQTVTVPANGQITAGRIAFSAGAVATVDVAQIILVDGSWQPTWYTTTPAPAMLLIVGSGTGVAPPGQSNSSTGWPCYATMAVPPQGEWFHLAVDGGMENKNYYTAAGFAMPSAWLNGEVLRMWTSGPFDGTTFTGWIGSVGAKVCFNGSINVVLAATSVPVSADEFYIPDNNISATGRVTAAKALAHYNYGLIRHDFVAQDSGARVGAVLDSIGWPSGLRDVDTGDNNILAQLPDASLTGLSCIQDAVNVEGGFYYIAGDGTFTFWNQSHTAPPLSITIGDGSGEVPFQPGISLSYDDVYIYNHVELTQKITDGSGSTALSAQSDDVASQNDYGVRAAPATSAPWSQQSDMSSLADAIVTAYKQPATRVASVQVESVSTGTFASTLPRDLGDLVRVKIRPKGSGPTISVDGYVQGLSLAITDVSWLFTFSLSPTLAGH